MSDEKKSGAVGIKSLYSLGGLGLIAVILVLVNVIFQQITLRWDITDEKLYSLSEGSKNILSSLKEDVTIKMFFTRDLPNIPAFIKNYETNTLDYLSEYKYHGKGRVKIEILNPKPDSETEEWAQKYGIDGRQLPSGDKLYFGLVVLAADQEVTMPFIDPTREKQLEYDITKMIYKVQSPEKRKVGVISGLPIFGAPPDFRMNMQAKGTDPWYVIEELRKVYEVIEIRPEAEKIEDGLDLLVVIHPKNLNDKLQYAIDQHVVKGGNLVAYVDPYSVFDQSPGRDKSSSLDKLFAAWGVKMDKGKVLVDYDYPYNGRGEVNPTFASLDSAAFNKDNIVTVQLERMLMTGVGVFEKQADSTYEYESLIKSSANSMLMDSFRLQFGLQGISRDFQATVDQYDLAVKITGKFKTAFAAGKPKSEDGSKEESGTEHLAEGEESGTVIIAGDADMLFDNTYLLRQTIPLLGYTIVNMANDNLNFLLNLAENMTSGNELISIRSRGKFERPFEKVDELERKARERWMVKEQELSKKADEVNKKLRELESKKDESQRFILSEDQEKEIAKFKEEKRKNAKELRRVRGKLREEIEDLGTWIKVINIGLMPLLVSLAGIGYGLYRRKKSVS